MPSALLDISWRDITAGQLYDDVLIQGDLDSGARIVGLYRGFGVDSPPLAFGVIGAGVNYVQFIGVDTLTDQIVTGWTVEIEAQASPP